MKKTFASFLLTVILAGTLGAQGLINRRAPSFSLPDSNFTQYDILDYRGKWLLIEFMVTSPQSCPQCKEINKKLEGLLAKHGSKLSVLSIANTPPETQDTIKAYIADTKTKIPVLFDASMVGIAYFKATPQRGAFDPGHVFAINPQGTIVQEWNAQLASSAAFTADVDKLITGAAAPASKSKPKSK